MSETTPEAELYGIVPEEFGPETIDGDHPPLTDAPSLPSGAPGDQDLAAQTEVEAAD